MQRLYRNWTVHNLISHPLSEVVYLIARPLVGHDRASDMSGFIHDLTVPEHDAGTGRG